MVHISGSISGPHHFPYKNSGFRVCVNKVLREGFKSFRRFLVFWFKISLFKKGKVAIPFFNFWLWWLLVDVSLEYFLHSDLEQDMQVGLRNWNSLMERLSF